MLPQWIDDLLAISARTLDAYIDTSNMKYSNPKLSQDSKLVTIKQASQMLGVSEKTIRRRIKDNTLKAANVEPRETNHPILIKLDDLRELAKSQGKPIGDVEIVQGTQARNTAEMELDPNLIKDTKSLIPTIELIKLNIEIGESIIKELEQRAKKASEGDRENLQSKINKEKITQAQLKKKKIIYEAILNELQTSKKSENS